jgi:hypothetical protein
VIAPTRIQHESEAVARLVRIDGELDDDVVVRARALTPCPDRESHRRVRNGLEVDPAEVVAICMLEDVHPDSGATGHEARRKAVAPYGPRVHTLQQQSRRAVVDIERVDRATTRRRSDLIGGRGAGARGHPNPGGVQTRANHSDLDGAISCRGQGQDDPVRYPGPVEREARDPASGQNGLLRADERGREVARVHELRAVFDHGYERGEADWNRDRVRPREDPDQTASRGRYPVNGLLNAGRSGPGCRRSELSGSGDAPKTRPHESESYDPAGQRRVCRDGGPELGVGQEAHLTDYLTRGVVLRASVPMLRTEPFMRDP